MRPGWRLKKARGPGGPAGVPDGTYSRDYAYVPGIGDRDECNGREPVRLRSARRPLALPPLGGPPPR
jgi:hypothetical protein